MSRLEEASAAFVALAIMALCPGCTDPAALALTPSPADVGPASHDAGPFAVGVTAVNNSASSIELLDITLDSGEDLSWSAGEEPRLVLAGSERALSIALPAALGGLAAPPSGLRVMWTSPGAAETTTTLPLRWLLECDFDRDGADALQCGGQDCDDSDPTRHPDAVEQCDKVDHNCDGETASLEDQDGDGFSLCDDCDDTDSAVRPGATEACNGLDDDCDGTVPESEDDSDDDGSWACNDCDDENPAVAPGLPELCDGLDNDCDGWSEADKQNEVDADADGVLSCEDCDDEDPDTYPGALEICDGIDRDCDPATPDGVGEADDDADGFIACDECDDANAAVNPGAEEACDGLDTDCDGEANWPGGDETDGDGDGSPACADCDDDDATLAPHLPEACDGQDNDCDGLANADALGEIDGDQDGVLSCADCDDNDLLVSPLLPEVCDGVDTDCSGQPDADPGGETDDDGDTWLSCEECDDSSATVYPGAPELCDGQDNDCNGSADHPDGEADGDGDGWLACEDCDDGASEVHPSAEEQCDGEDQDCDGSSDNGWSRVPQDHPTIQAAIDSQLVAASVCVAPGLYEENVTFGGRDVRLVSTGGPGVTVIGGGYSGTVITIPGGSGGLCRIEGFTIAEGQADEGGGLFAEATACALTDVSFDSNRAAIQGAGLRSVDVDWTWTRVEFLDSSGYGPFDGGSGFHLSGGSLDALHLRVEGSAVGGGSLDGVGSATISQAQFVDNSAGAGGGGLHLFISNLLLTHSLIAGNSAGTTGGGITSVSSSLVLDHVAMAGNSAARGGALKVTGGSVELAHCAVVGNTASVTAGAIETVYSPTMLTLSHSIVAFNEAIPNVGGLLVGGSLLSDHTVFWGNSSIEVAGVPNPVGIDGNIAVDPEYLDWGSGEAAFWDLHLGTTSFVRDSGAPALSDPDGSTADPGVFGGASADEWDLDADGYPLWWQPGSYDSSTYPPQGWDCDDHDPSSTALFGCS